MISFSAIYSVYTTLGAAIGQLSKNFGYDSQANSLFGSVYIFGGLTGSFIHAFFLDKYARYKLQYVIIGILSLGSLILVTVIIGEKNLYLTAASLFFMGFGQLPIIGVSYSFWAELTYPINEALSWGILQLFGSVVATIFTFLASTLIQQNKTYYAFYTLIGLLSVGLIWKLLVREILRKKRAGIRGTIFSFHVGNQSMMNTYLDEINDERAPLVDTFDIDRISLG